MIYQFFILTLNNLRYRQLRSWLTALGIVIGVAMILALLLLGSGLRAAVAGQLQQFGSDLIYVLPGEEGNPIMSAILGDALRDKDAAAVREVAGVETAMPIVERLSMMEFGGQQKTINLHAQPLEEMKIVFEGSQGFRLSEGRWPASEHSREIILGHSVAYKRFDEDARLGDEVIVHGRKFTVVGIMKLIGEETHDRSVFISLENFRSLTGVRDNIRSIVVKAEPGLSLDDLAEDIRYRLEQQVGLERFSVFTSGKAARLVGNIIGVLELALSAIASVALLVGGIGIMNTMYMSVMERTRDIGVMKAVGASRRDILIIFLIESGLIGLVGGAAGVALGTALGYGAEFVAASQGFVFLDVSLRPLLAAQMIFFALALGTLSGLLPARRAARLEPVEALQYE